MQYIKTFLMQDGFTFMAESEIYLSPDICDMLCKNMLIKCCQNSCGLFSEI